MTTDDRDEQAISFFQDLLRFRTVSFEGPKTGAYRKCAEWLVEKLSAIGLQTQVLESVPNKPVVIATLLGTYPELPSVLLNSHYDVVPAMESFWHVDPWAAVRKDGKIYGRGTQDMKCVCAQYILALERLMGEGFHPARSLHLTFVPDEEVGGEGMASLLASDIFKGFNVGLALDEGIANPEDKYTVFYGERMPLWVRVKATGNTGHGSRFIAGTAVEKLVRLAQKALDFRTEQEKRLGHDGAGCKHSTALKLGDVTSLNLTMLKAGVTTDGGDTYAFNVIPNEADAGFDIRIPPSVPSTDVIAMLDQWTSEEGVSWEFAKEAGEPLLEHHTTATDRDKNPWFGVFSDAMASRGATITPEVFPASTDARFVRALKIPALGFSPLRNSPILLHEHNEYVDESVFLEGIEVYHTLIHALANAPKFDNEVGRTCS